MVSSLLRPHAGCWYLKRCRATEMEGRSLGILPFELSSWHDTQHEFSKERYREFGVAMGGAEDHALFEEPGSQGRDGLDLDPEKIGDLARPLRPAAQFRQCPQVVLLARSKPVKAN